MKLWLQIFSAVVAAGLLLLGGRAAYEYTGNVLRARADAALNWRLNADRACQAVSGFQNVTLDESQMGLGRVTLDQIDELVAHAPAGPNYMLTELKQARAALDKVLSAYERGKPARRLADMQAWQQQADQLATRLGTILADYERQTWPQKDRTGLVLKKTMDEAAATIAQVPAGADGAKLSAALSKAIAGLKKAHD